MLVLVACLGVMIGNEIHGGLGLLLQLGEEEPYGHAHNATPEEADEDVARIVDSKIEARPAIQQRPQHHGHRQQTAAHKQGDEDGNAERVGGMG